MDSKVLVVCQLCCKGVGKRSDAHLDAGSVGNQLRAVLSDENLGRGRFCEILGNQGSVILDKIVEDVYKKYEGKEIFTFHSERFDLEKEEVCLEPNPRKKYINMHRDLLKDEY
jgi:hypothetical protein